MDAHARSFLDLPRWVPARNDDRAGFIQLAADGLWRAYNWTGSLGAFTTDLEAEAAIRAAPAKPKLKKAPKQTPSIELQFKSLTAIEAGYLVCDARKGQIGAVIGLASGQYAAWNRAGKIGESATPGQAEVTVRAADRTGPPRK
jgi:hypothetical protein